MGGLPDEMWREILRRGIGTSKLTYKDVCCIAISSKQLNNLSAEDHLWSILLTLDFPQSHLPVLDNDNKKLYKSRFQREKERKLAAHRRAVLRIQSQIAVRVAKLKELRRQWIKEKERLKAAVEELNNFERARTASVALNVWQPEIVRGKHKRVVEQCLVPAGSRVRALDMEIRVSKQQIEVLEKGCTEERQRLDAAKTELESINYHPLRAPSSAALDEFQNPRKSKKMKQTFQ